MIGWAKSFLKFLIVRCCNGFHLFSWCLLVVLGLFGVFGGSILMVGSFRLFGVGCGLIMVVGDLEFGSCIGRNLYGVRDGDLVV